MERASSADGLQPAGYAVGTGTGCEGGQGAARRRTGKQQFRGAGRTRRRFRRRRRDGRPGIAAAADRQSLRLWRHRRCADHPGGDGRQSAQPAGRRWRRAAAGAAECAGGQPGCEQADRDTALVVEGAGIDRAGLGPDLQGSGPDLSADHPVLLCAERHVGLWRGAERDGAILLPQRPEGLSRHRFLHRIARALRRAGRFRPGLCDRA